ncbi:hypothetical protein VCUG_00353 [Vavraia culicis subsp. floridensis]|uniref:Uncharacterized protein n=1 Tax=Vavraia culicis (isolate floridensis) TaxID=948595 RepID=L2GYE2_VAVCU|nr:uncharacterized protein VCUG_00353 [Vavraia culicis subsp. floridensis]ELA48115.1 hypothetical protein VCUG_00353 [Vavraia culicis subsp. floridensis]
MIGHIAFSNGLIKKKYCTGQCDWVQETRLFRFTTRVWLLIAWYSIVQTLLDRTFHVIVAGRASALTFCRFTLSSKVKDAGHGSWPFKRIFTTVLPGRSWYNRCETYG